LRITINYRNLKINKSQIKTDKYGLYFGEITENKNVLVTKVFSSE
jgi:hypothetical protein